MTSSEQALDLANVTHANLMARERRQRLEKICALEVTPQQQEAMQWARIDFAAAATRAFRLRVQAFAIFGAEGLRATEIQATA